MKRIKEMDWWYWLATNGLLIGSLMGWPWDIYPAIGLTIIHLVHYLVLEKNISAFSVQVRLGYLLLLISGMFSPLYFIHWIQLAGTTAVITVGYCPLARLLVLMPWNRNKPLTFYLVWNIIVAPPVEGSILTAQYEK